MNCNQTFLLHFSGMREDIHYRNGNTIKVPVISMSYLFLGNLIQDAYSDVPVLDAFIKIRKLFYGYSGNELYELLTLKDSSPLLTTNKNMTLADVEQLQNRVLAVNKGGAPLITVYAQTDYHRGKLDGSNGHVFNLYFDAIMKMHNIPRYSYIVIGDFNWYLINRRGYSCTNLLALRIDDNKFEITVVYSNQFYSLNETKNSVRRAAISPEIPLQEVDVKSFYLLAYCNIKSAEPYYHEKRGSPL